MEKPQADSDLIKSLERWGATHSLRSYVARQYPNDKIELVSSATFLKAPGIKPVGWTLRRIFQLRGNIAITKERVIFDSSFRSPISLLFALLALTAAFLQEVGPASFWQFISILALSRWISYRPYLKEFRLADVLDVQFERLNGMAISANVMSLSTVNGCFHVIFARKISDELQSQIKASLFKVDEAE